MKDFLEIEYTETHSQQLVHEKSKKHTKVTDPLMTPFEYAKLLSSRAYQISQGYPLKVDWNGLYDPINIAKYEIEQRVCPLVIERRIPDASRDCGYRVEEWSLKEMDIRDF